MLTSRYAVAGEGIVSEAFDGDIVVLDLDSGRYFSFNDTGCALWEGLVEGAMPRSLLVADAAFTGDDLLDFLRQLLDYGLLCAASSPANATASKGTVEKLAAAREKPSITAFD